MKEKPYPPCNVCNGTGKYDNADLARLWDKYYKNRKGKKHKCEGSCRTCGQFFTEVDLDWLDRRLENIEKGLKFLIDIRLKHFEKI